MTAGTAIVPTRPDSGAAFALVETAQMTITGVGEIRERRPRTGSTAHVNKRCAMSLPKMARRRGVVTTADARSALRVPALAGVDR